MKQPFLVIGGLFIIIFICIVPLKRHIQEYNVQKNGKLVTATITYIPNFVGCRTMHFIDFIYAGKKFDKKVGCGFAGTYKIGETIKFRHIDGTKIFLFENEKIEKEFISFAVLAVFGIVIIVIGARKRAR
jgi:hypothetical protein